MSINGWTAEALLARTVEEGDCLLWKGSMASTNIPTVCVEADARRSVRRLLWQMLNGPIPANKFASCSCGEPRCVAPEHLVLMTKRQIAKRTAKTGVFANHVRVAKIAATKRAASPITWDDVARIRSAPRGQGLAIAKELGVSQMTVWRIRHHKSWKQPPSGFSVFSLGAMVA